MDLKSKCPACGSTNLSFMSGGGGDIQSCEQCGATWATKGKVTKEQLDLLGAVSGETIAITCPKCGNTMETPSMRGSGFNVKNMCNRCFHTW